MCASFRVRTLPAGSLGSSEILPCPIVLTFPNSLLHCPRWLAIVIRNRKLSLPSSLIRCATQRKIGFLRVVMHSLKCWGSLRVRGRLLLRSNSGKSSGAVARAWCLMGKSMAWAWQKTSFPAAMGNLVAKITQTGLRFVKLSMLRFSPMPSLCSNLPLVTV